MTTTHRSQFAVVLRDACRADPMRFFAAMASPERCRLLAGLWQQVERAVGSPLAGHEQADTRVLTTALRHRPTILVTLPEPQADGESFFAGLVLAPLPKRDEAATAMDFRYFTLERLATGAQFREWAETQETTSIAPTLEAFRGAIETRLA